MVRARLAADPQVHRVPVDKAEIWALSDFVNAEERERLIELVDAGAEPSKVLGNDEYGAWRSSYSGNVDRYDPLVQMIERRIDDLIGLPNAWGETIQGQRYAPGQEFKDHMDWFWTKAPYWPKEAREGGQRSITAMIYLCDVAKGGETEFPNIGVSIPPQAGALIIWNNAESDGTPNDFTLHAGRPVVEGVKYVITKWYRTRDWG
ncbi:MAG TPA: 2OG-Fe(II) oxygenase [Novosphingobium sp.]|nr:2OG-Fe(II) oxygenase [Novosphingobium sp.]